MIRNSLTTNNFLVFWIISSLFFICTGCIDQKKVSQPGNYELFSIRNRGLAYLEENSLDEAEREFSLLIEKAPGEAMGYANLGVVFMRMGQLEDAEKQINYALTLSPGDPDMLLNLTEIRLLLYKSAEALQTLENNLRLNPNHAKTHYKIAKFHLGERDRDSRWAEIAQHLDSVVKLLPGNIVARLQVVEALIELNQPDQALIHLEEIRRQVPELDGETVDFYKHTFYALKQSDTQKALINFRAFHNLMKRTFSYRFDTIELLGPGREFIGFPTVHFKNLGTNQLQKEMVAPAVIEFTDITAKSGLDELMDVLTGSSTSNFECNLAIGDYDGDRDPDIFVSTSNPRQKRRRNFLFRNDQGTFKDATLEAGLNLSGNCRNAIFGDYNNDGRLDMFVVCDSENHLMRNEGTGKFTDVTGNAKISGNRINNAALMADFDHDGDLDIFVLSASGNLLYRNNFDGSFSEIARKAGLEGKNKNSRDAAFADFDDDGDLDIFVVNEKGGNSLYTNLRQGYFKDVTAQSGLDTKVSAGAVTVGDYDNDGDLDIFVSGLGGDRCYFYLNRGDGTFAIDPQPATVYQTLQGVSGRDAVFLDFDNDGYLDLLVAGKHNMADSTGSQGVFLFENDGNGVFRNASDILPKDLTAAQNVAITDFDSDGDQDIFLATPGGIRLLRNDGGNVNRWLAVKLVGLSGESGKNNLNGIGTTIEVKAGNLYQKRVVTEPVTFMGMGEYGHADIVRVVWTNGVPQNEFDIQSSRQIEVVEKQVLKGSCAFLYTWNGQEYTFVTDIMWRSALGMPLGIMGGETAYAFPNASDEHLKIPGHLLHPKNGRYSLQITEELWETCFFDQSKLIVVDHPESVEIYIDERFTPPPVPPLKIYPVSQKHYPVSATNQNGVDLLSLIEEKDNQYISDMIPTRYQGIMEPHDLILDLGNLSSAKNVVLFMNGWLFPTDASINVAVSQSGDFTMIPPYLQVVDQNGNWQTVIEQLSFPMGKDKMLIADLSRKFLSKDYRIRIRTSMQIYWDHIFFTVDEPEVPLRFTTLTPVSADLHYRGFSRLYRKGRYGPHWFDYSQVDPEPRWRDLIGHYTRYGDVTPLLKEADDQYIIINAGDEVTIEYNATVVPPLQQGWHRDFLIYSDGWIKDGDLNTAYGKTVEPLPFHGMTRYPYGDSEHFPTDQIHSAFRAKYNTRKVTSESFRKLRND